MWCVVIFVFYLFLDGLLMLATGMFTTAVCSHHAGPAFSLLAPTVCHTDLDQASEGTQIGQFIRSNRFLNWPLSGHSMLAASTLISFKNSPLEKGQSILTPGWHISAFCHAPLASSSRRPSYPSLADALSLLWRTTDPLASMDGVLSVPFRVSRRRAKACVPRILSWPTRSMSMTFGYV